MTNPLHSVALLNGYLIANGNEKVNETKLSMSFDSIISDN